MKWSGTQTEMASIVDKMFLMLLVNVDDNGVPILTKAHMIERIPVSKKCNVKTVQNFLDSSTNSKLDSSLD